MKQVVSRFFFGAKISSIFRQFFETRWRVPLFPRAGGARGARGGAMIVTTRRSQGDGSKSRRVSLDALARGRETVCEVRA